MSTAGCSSWTMSCIPFTWDAMASETPLNAIYVATAVRTATSSPHTSHVENTATERLCTRPHLHTYIGIVIPAFQHTYSHQLYGICNIVFLMHCLITVCMLKGSIINLIYTDYCREM